MSTIKRVVGAVVVIGGAGMAAFTWVLRTKFPPVLDRVRRFNRDVANPRQLRDAGGPGAWASVVSHVGRRTNTPYRTPVVAVPTEDGFVVALPYGSSADWVRNVMAAGGATITHEGDSVPVTEPVLLDLAEANRHFPTKEQWLHRIYRVDEFLRVRTVPAATS